MSPPPQRVSDAGRRALFDRLAEHGYDHEGCARRLGLWGPERLVRSVQAWHTVGPRAQHRPRTGDDASPLDLLIALLLFGDAVGRDAIAGALGRTGCDALLESGLARVEGSRILANVMLFPCQGLLLTTDRLDGDRRLNLVMPLFRESYDLGRLAVRVPIARAVDTCTGSGIHALLAARHAREAYGVDISGRALGFARFNAWMNGIENVTWLEGDVFGPLPEGVRYRLITANPPYNPEIVSAAGDDWHSGGESGEEVLERVVTEVPRLLEPGGYAQVITLLIHREGDPLHERILRWLGPGFDVLLLSKPMDYEPLVLEGGLLSPADQALHESWKRQRITRFEFGVINVRHAAAGRKGRIVQGPSHQNPEAGDVRGWFSNAGLH